MQINFDLDAAQTDALFQSIRAMDGIIFHYTGPTSKSYEVIDTPPTEPMSLLIAPPDTVSPVSRHLIRSIATSILKSGHKPTQVIPKDQILGSQGFVFEPIELRLSIWPDSGRRQPGRLWLNGTNDVTIQFYHILCRLIRKRCLKNDAGIWVGQTKFLPTDQN